MCPIRLLVNTTSSSLVSILDDIYLVYLTTLIVVNGVCSSKLPFIYNMSMNVNFHVVYCHVFGDSRTFVNVNLSQRQFFQVCLDHMCIQDIHISVIVLYGFLMCIYFHIRMLRKSVCDLPCSVICLVNLKLCVCFGYSLNVLKLAEFLPV